MQISLLGYIFGKGHDNKVDSQLGFLIFDFEDPFNLTKPNISKFSFMLFPHNSVSDLQFYLLLNCDIFNLAFYLLGFVWNHFDSFGFSNSFLLLR